MRKAEQEGIEKQAELAQLIGRFTGKGDGTHSTAIPSLHFIRSSAAGDPVYTVHKPALCIVAQGAKEVMLAEARYHYDVTQYLVAAVNLPLSGQILQASEEAPYLCLRLDIEPAQLVDLVMETNQSEKKKTDSYRGLFVSKSPVPLLDAVLRLVRLLDSESPQEISVLAPLAIKEILFRILNGEHGEYVRQFALSGGHAQRIAEVIQVIEHNFDKPLPIEQLAKAVNMCASSLHHHFRQITAMSPLQFQKQLRLQEARRLLLSEGMEAASAGFHVGYESPSQFSREYTRMFGLPPISDIKRLRDSLAPAETR